MKTIVLFVLAPVLLCLWSGCDWELLDILGDPVPHEAVLAGKYLYYGFDSDGALIIQGALTLVREDTDRLTGTWEFEVVGDPPPEGYGPQVGSGKLVGTVDTTQVVINLNPDYADNNVVLQGTYSRTVLSGKWEFIGFPGVLNRGSFRAIRVTGKPSATGVEPI